MAILTVCLFGDCLFIPGRVPVAQVSDLRDQYFYWRQFAFGQIRAGHFPLWNPYEFCGMPFFGDPQSAMLYPPNWVYLVLSPEVASTWLAAIHFFLAGWFAGLFCRWRGAGNAACILGGMLYACSAPIITNLLPGHLPLIFSAAWAPLLLGCVERIVGSSLEKRPPPFPSPGLPGEGIRWMLLGVVPVALLALDGYPQFAYYTALAAGLYALIRLPGAVGKWKAIGGVALMFAFGWAIASVQIVASAQAAAESVRAGGLSFDTASEYSLPPENLLTMIIPGLFGDATHLLYFGRWYWWETCLFIGPAALALAAMGWKAGGGKGLFLVAGIMLVLALGSNTPVFYVLYRVVPGFSSFRASARFGMLGLLFLSVLAALGWDRCLAGGGRSRLVAGIFAAVGVFLGLGAVWAMNAESKGPGDFTNIIQSMAATGEMMESVPLTDPTFSERASSFAAEQLAIAAGVTLLVAGLFLSPSPGTPGEGRGGGSAEARNMPPPLPSPGVPGEGSIVCKAAVAIGILALGQIIWFAVSQRVSSESSTPMPVNWKSVVAAVPAGQRVLINTAVLADSGASNGFINVVGTNPLVLNRTARFLAAIQQVDPNDVGFSYPVRIASGVYRMLRCAVIMPGRRGGPVYPIAHPLPRLLLVGQCTVAAGPDAALAAVMERGFDPGQSVVLEEQPQPIPTAGAETGKTIQLIHATSDELEIEADLPASQILLVTDAFSSGWRAVAFGDSVQKEYHVLPADYCLRGIPLTAGHHHFRLEYRPAGLTAGAWISGLSLAAYAICLSRLARPAR
jgi:hypothetical protein